jgi:hypothetical protein
MGTLVDDLSLMGCKVDNGVPIPWLVDMCLCPHRENCCHCRQALAVAGGWRCQACLRLALVWCPDPCTPGFLCTCHSAPTPFFLHVGGWILLGRALLHDFWD